MNIHLIKTNEGAGVCNLISGSGRLKVYLRTGEPVQIYIGGSNVELVRNKLEQVFYTQLNTRSGPVELEVREVDHINIKWSIAEVRAVAPNATDNQCRNILSDLKLGLDYSQGVTWCSVASLCEKHGLEVVDNGTL